MIKIKISRIRETNCDVISYRFPPMFDMEVDILTESLEDCQSFSMNLSTSPCNNKYEITAQTFVTGTEGLLTRTIDWIQFLLWMEHALMAIMTTKIQRLTHMSKKSLFFVKKWWARCWVPSTSMSNCSPQSTWKWTFWPNHQKIVNPSRWSWVPLCGIQ